MFGNKVYEKLYKQYSLDDIIFLSDIRTEEDKERYRSQNYPVCFTADEWNDKYPMIPAEHVACKRTVLFPQSLMYIDEEKYIVVNNS